ncbi:MAG: AIR synthase family protein [Chloroflexota bacterium]
MLKTGKLDPDTLRRLLHGRLGVRRDDVAVHARLGEDAAAITFGDELCVVSSDPITGAAANAGWYAIQVSCNDIAAMGATPVGVLATILLPESSDESEAVRLMDEMHGAALELGIEILGGHTEVTASANAPILSLTALGRAPRERLVASGGGRAGDALVLTKAAAIEGTAILAADLAPILAPRVGQAILDRARRFIDELSVVREGTAAVGLGATAMHDPTEGGVLGALWELSEAAGLGFEVSAEAIPVRPETAQICHALDADPLRLISSGALLIACGDPDRMLSGLRQAGVAAACIGRLTAAERLVRYADGTRPAGPVVRDELWRVLEAQAGPRA